MDEPILVSPSTLVKSAASRSFVHTHEDVHVNLGSDDLFVSISREAKHKGRNKSKSYEDGSSAPYGVILKVADVMDIDHRDLETKPTARKKTPSSMSGSTYTQTFQYNQKFVQTTNEAVKRQREYVRQKHYSAGAPYEAGLFKEMQGPTESLYQSSYNGGTLAKQKEFERNMKNAERRSNPFRKKPLVWRHRMALQAAKGIEKEKQVERVKPAAVREPPEVPVLCIPENIVDEDAPFEEQSPREIASQRAREASESLIAAGKPRRRPPTAPPNRPATPHDRSWYMPTPPVRFRATPRPVVRSFTTAYNPANEPGKRLRVQMQYSKKGRDIHPVEGLGY
eukprot:TRINITY_DN17252_c0_g1_i1.p1 TRINITY_DN17252_c0_g1~~TRINITY_DN17252_c0_g1_i1.p1  ORF type:complete len:338 (+),score=41.89 TRINITY_DN17252_c0_g1_i1:52-1065(+)